MFSGIDRLVANRFQVLKDMNVGLCTNISSCDSYLEPTIELFGRQKKFKLTTILAPEHGLFGALQDQIKVKHFYDRKKKIMIYNLYGNDLIPDSKILKKLDTVVIDLQDIGTRYYTFLWSAILLIQQFARLKKKVVVLDRPNPINGIRIQGPVLEPEFSSFVGLYPIPIQHGMTIGELCNLINSEYHISAELEIIEMKEWRRHYYFDDIRIPWTVPSPNMPSLNTALVYPGMCLLEGTNVSEGRGTTRPFEIIGAPWIDPFCLANELRRTKIQGVNFRPTFFIPTFNKYKNKLCGGVQIHIKSRKTLNAVVMGLTIIKIIKKLYPKKFRWRTPPYEFEKHKMPFDILIGNAWVRKAIEHNKPITVIRKKWMKKLNKFKKIRKKYLLYS